MRRSVRVAAAIVLAVGSTYLIAAPITSNIDVSDQWAFLRLVFILTLPVLRIGFSGCMPLRWLRNTTCTLCALLCVPAGLVLLFSCVFESAWAAREAPLFAPDGSHIALLRFHKGFMSVSPSARISVRPAWWPFTKTAFDGSEPSVEPGYSPLIQWLNSSTLQIRYWADEDVPANCEKSAGDIRIVCEKMPTQ